MNNKKELKVKLLEGLENLETDKIGNGGKELKGYFLFGVYFKVRKRQYGNLWTTQLVTLFREEVRKLEERHNTTAVTILDMPVSQSFERYEIDTFPIKESDRVSYRGS